MSCLIFLENQVLFCLKCTHICYNHVSAILQGVKVLVIDDNEDITSMFSKFFNSSGYETVVTTDPMEGLRHIQQEQYDVVLLDISMPVISGFNIIQILATDETLKDQNIFIFSGTDLHESQIKDLLRREGVNGFFKKPIELAELLIAITS